MPEKEGILCMQPSRRWAVSHPGRDPVEITSGELFRVEVDGELQKEALRNAACKPLCASAHRGSF
jgi:hypothetical protein